MKDKILCICPLYNKIQFLPYSIGSVLNQEGVNVTMVIVDDCSTDGSYEWVQEKVGHYPNVHILRNEENIGCYQTRNKGLKYAIDNGIEFDYYTVTDPDDQQIDKRFFTYINVFHEVPAAMVIKQPYIRYNLDTGDSVEKHDAGEGAAMFRREIFDILGYWDNTMRFSGDTEYINRLINWYARQNIQWADHIGVMKDIYLYALTDNTGQNLTSLFPGSHPDRRATWLYIDEYSGHSKIEDTYYEYNNTGHAYSGMGIVEVRN